MPVCTYECIYSKRAERKALSVHVWFVRLKLAHVTWRLYPITHNLRWILRSILRWILPWILRSILRWILRWILMTRTPRHWRYTNNSTLCDVLMSFMICWCTPSTAPPIANDEFAELGSIVRRWWNTPRHVFRPWGTSEGRTQFHLGSAWH